jgi:hypothetical protein
LAVSKRALISKGKMTRTISAEAMMACQSGKARGEILAPAEAVCFSADAELPLAEQLIHEGSGERFVFW